LGDDLRNTLFVAAIAGPVLLSNQAFAQRADENVLTAAEDAFGTKVGNDSIGLYDQRNTRGFDPQAAGNVRVEGMYIDLHSSTGARLQRSVTMRVGIAAQSYPFPAPTGIADMTIQIPRDYFNLSASVQYYGSGLSYVNADFSTPVIKDKLAVGGGIAYFEISNDFNQPNQSFSWATFAKWTPNENIEIIPFHYVGDNTPSSNQPAIFTAGAYLPPTIDPGIYFGQYWTVRGSDDYITGVLTRATLSDNWRLQTGFFRNLSRKSEGYSSLFRNTQLDGSATQDIIGFPTGFAESYSGEARLSGNYTQGSYRHTVHIAVRGRDTTRVFGGTTTQTFGAAQIGVLQRIPKPAFTFGVRDRDHVLQVTPGVAYIGQWLNVGEFSVGLQKSFFSRDVRKEGGVPAETTSKPWLYNGTATFYATNKLAIYAGYTRGIEEFGTAPDNAANRGQPVPADLTEQVDAGIRYRLIPGLSLMAGVFQVSKPYFDRDAANVYTAVGSLRHRGIELSLTGKPVPNLTAILGAVFLQARITGPAVTAGTLGEVPVGAKPRLFRANLQYDFPQLKGLAVDTQMEYIGAQYANRLNTFSVPSVVTFGAGLRYATRINDVATTLRLQVTNITDVNKWTVASASGQFSPTSPRKFMARIGTDF